MENIEANKNNTWETGHFIRDNESLFLQLEKFHCQNCGKLLGKYKSCEQLEIKCPRCRHINTINNKY